MAPATGTPCASKCEALSTISSIGRPTPPSEMMTVGARSIEATRAFDSPTTAPTPGVARALDEPDVVVDEVPLGREDRALHVLDDVARRGSAW